MDASALAELLNPEVDPAPHLRDVAMSLANESEPERQLAVVVLGRIGEPAAEHLIHALDPAQPDIVRTTAATVLAGLSPPVVSAVRSLCRCLTSPEESLRTVASLALGKIGAPAVPSLRLLLKFSDPDVVAAAISSLSMIGTPAAESLGDLEVLSSGPLQLSCAAAMASVSGDAARGLPVLLRASEHSDPAIRIQALQRITELGAAAHPAISQILARLGDPVPAVRAAAALTLARINAPANQALHSLITTLADPEADVRLNAAIALSGFGKTAADAAPALRNLALDGDTRVVAASAAALGKIESAQ
jgi:HEAT repeat protein